MVIKDCLSRRPLIYLITDRKKLRCDGTEASSERLIEFVRAAAAGGVDLVQVREKDLTAREVVRIASEAAPAINRHRSALLVNDRVDIAAATGSGVHLAADSIRAHVVRRWFGDAMLIGASTHSIAEASAAASDGADFIVFGPVFETESKQRYGPPVGLDALAEACRRVSIPVLALGGVTMQNFQSALLAGASGIAGISLFTSGEDIRRIVESIRNRVVRQEGVRD